MQAVQKSDRLTREVIPEVAVLKREESIKRVI
jgi:hypothetical protein